MACGHVGTGTFIGEVVAIVGLPLIIFGMVRSGRDQLVAFGVGGFIAGAYIFTSSTAHRRRRNRRLDGMARQPSA